MADAALGTTLDPEDLNPDAKPKTGRHDIPTGKPPGRPRKDGAPAGSARRRLPPATLKREVGGMLWSLNMVVGFVPPLRDDMLDEAEIALLAQGISDQCQRSPRFRGWVEAALTAQGGYSLILAVALIGGRRAVRHGLIGGTAEERTMRDGQLGALIAYMADPKAAAEMSRVLESMMAAQQPIEAEPEGAAAAAAPSGNGFHETDAALAAEMRALDGQPGG